jgi:sodium ion-translocating decarboxylase, beta subunit
MRSSAIKIIYFGVIMDFFTTIKDAAWTFIQGNWMNAIMWVIGGVLIYLAIKKEMEPTLLLPIGFGAILVNLPGSTIANEGQIIKLLYDIGIANEFFPLVLFIGIGAMIDFGPVLTNPKLMLFGAAAQFGIFFTLSMATLLNDIGIEFSALEAASISIIGAADGPTSIVVARELLGSDSRLFGPIVVAAYSYMALVPIIQRPVVKLITTKKERLIRMEYKQRDVSKTTRILFPIIITAVVGFVAPDGLPLIGCLMFGNLIRECGVLNSLSETAQKVLANLITIFLGISIAATMKAEAFLHPNTLIVLGLGLVAFIFDTVGGVFFAKFINLFTKKKINPMIGACGISAFPMSARVIHKMGQEEDNQNFLLMHAIGANVSGQIASVVAGGLILSIFMQFPR